TPSERQTVWAAISRAVRTPTRVETATAIDLTTLPPGALSPGSPVTISRFIGNPDFFTERLIAYEAGYRVSPTERFSIDIATFLNHYEDLRSSEPGTPFLVLTPTPHLVVPFTFENLLAGNTYGVEVDSSWKVTDHWRLSAGYTLLQMQLHPVDGSRDTTTASETNGQSPKHQFNLRSYLDLTRHLQLYPGIYFLDSFPRLVSPRSLPPHAH